MDADFGEIQPEELRFLFKPNTRISCFVKLTNNYDRHIAFNLYLTHKELYHCRPKEGIIKPQSTCDVEIMRRKQDVAPLQEAIAKERLYFKRIFVPEDTDIKDLTTIFRCHKCRPDTNKKYLKVVVDVIPEKMDSKIEQQDLKMEEAQQIKSMKLKIEDMGIRLKEAEETLSKFKEHKIECDYKDKKMRPSVFIKCFNVKLV